MIHTTHKLAIEYAQFKANETKRVWFVNRLASSGPMKYETSERGITDTSFGGGIVDRIEPEPMAVDNRLFRVDGWGIVGAANLSAFAAFPGFKDWNDLEVNESTEGKFQNPTSDKKPERITRVS